MSYFDQYMNQQVMVELSGKITFSGILVDYGLDIIVVFNGTEFLYIPLMQLQHIRINSVIDPTLVSPSQSPIDSQTERIAFRKILMNAKGMFVKIYVSGNQIIHGYLISVLNDYFVFYSPVYKTMYISFNHLKWLIPYSQNVTPYSLNNQHLPVSPAQLTIPRTFEEQLKRLEGNIVIFDIGDHTGKTGLLKKVSNHMIQLVTGEGEQICWNLQHLKTVHVP